METEESRDLEAEAAELEERERTLRAEREALAAAEAELAAEQERLNREETEHNREFCHESHVCHAVTEGGNSSFASFAPMVRTQKQLCEFPVDALPDKIRPYIQATAESLQVSVDMVATFVIAIISLCVQGKYKIQVKPDWEEPVNLYAVVVMRPSERKSPTLPETVTRGRRTAAGRKQINAPKGAGRNGGDMPGLSGDCPECQTIKRGHQNNDTLQEALKIADKC